MTQRQSFLVLIAHMATAISILVAASVLCALHDLDAQAVIALFAAAIGLIGGNSQSLGTAVINGGSKPDLTKLAETSPDAAVRIAEGKQTSPTGYGSEHEQP